MTEPDDTSTAEATDGSAGRAIAYGLIAGAIVALILAGAAGYLAFTAGLIVIAYFMGRIVGTLVRVGAGGRLSSTARQSIAIVISVGWIGVGWVLVWLISRSEGGVLEFWDYLYETFGPLVPLDVIVATLAAWWSAR